MAENPKLGDIVFWYDENKQPHAAIVSYVHPRFLHDKPVCNLAIFKYDGRSSYKIDVEPAHHDGRLWKMMEKWSWPDEIPETEWSHLPLPTFRHRVVGAGQHLPTT